METNEIPETVIDALEMVRDSGETNMFSRDAVLYFANAQGADPDAVIWLYENKARYMEALTAMGERRRARAE